MSKDERLKIKANVLLDKSKTVLIIPFIYQKEEDNITNQLMSNGWKEADNIDRRNILEHINNLIPSNSRLVTHGMIGKEYHLEEHMREEYSLPTNISNKFHLMIEGEKRYSFKIEKVSLFLFETQIGFLTYEVKHLSKDIDDITLTNYHIKHLHHLYKGNLITEKEYYLTYISPKRNQINIDIPTRTLSSITSNLLEVINIKSYFSSLNKKPESAVVYNTIMLDESFEKEEKSQEKLGKYLFYLRRTFKRSYKPSPTDLLLKNNKQVIQLFENSYWGISLEGLSNVVYLTDDSVTNGFFSSNYISNLEYSYFYLYIIALHQRYALLSLNSQAQDLPISQNLSTEDFEKIQKLRKNINYFILRSFFKHVSSVTHQQKLYELIEKCLQIESLKEDLCLELDALSSVAELQQYYSLKERENKEQQSKQKQSEEKEKERQEQEQKERDEQKRREKHADTFLIYSTVFVVLSTITSTWSILADLFIKNTKPLVEVRADVALGIISIILIIIGLGAYYSVKRKWYDKIR